VITTMHRAGQRWLLATTLLVLAAPAGADIYRWIGRDGVVHLADRPLSPSAVRIMRTPRPAAARGARSTRDYRRDRRRYAPLVERVARALRLDSALVHAVVHVESGYDPRAVSRRGAVGLMQLMPETARRLGVRDRYDPRQNLYGGARYLRELLLRYRNVALALAAYNAGERAVERHGNRIPPYPETRRYVRKVLARYRELRRGR